MLEVFSGTESISTTEWSLVTDTSGPDTETSDGLFYIVLDLDNMAAGTTIRFRRLEKARSGDTQRVLDEIYFSGVQPTPSVELGPFSGLHGHDYTLLRTAGSDTTILWSIREAGGGGGGTAPTAVENAAAVWGYVIEDAYTAKDYMRGLASAVFWRLSGALARNPVFKAANGIKNRIVATITPDGRTSVTFDPSD